jgi:hypothetical protein
MVVAEPEKPKGPPSRPDILSSIGLVYIDPDNSFGDKEKFLAGHKGLRDNSTSGLDIPIWMKEAIEARQKRKEEWMLERSKSITVEKKQKPHVQKEQIRYGDVCSACGNKFALPPWLHGETHCTNCNAKLEERRHTPQRSRSTGALAPLDKKPSVRKEHEEARFFWVSTDAKKVHCCSDPWCNCSPLL